MSELAPVFQVQVWLDGDDDPVTQTDNFDNGLRVWLVWMLERGLIRNYQIKETA